MASFNRSIWFHDRCEFHKANQLSPDNRFCIFDTSSLSLSLLIFASLFLEVTMLLQRAFLTQRKLLRMLFDGFKPLELLIFCSSVSTDV